MEIAEYDGSGNILRRYIPGPGVDQRIAMIECGTSANFAANENNTDTQYYFADRLGNVLAVTDNTGNIVQQLFYTPFGVEMVGDASGNPFRYTGRKYDPETGLYYYRARYYDADLGRFLQVDPIGYADQWNLYAYVGNNPLNATDPSGMCDSRRGQKDCLDLESFPEEQREDVRRGVYEAGVAIQRHGTTDERRTWRNVEIISYDPDREFGAIGPVEGMEELLATHMTLGPFNWLVDRNTPSQNVSVTVVHEVGHKTLQGERLTRAVGAAHRNYVYDQENEDFIIEFGDALVYNELQPELRAVDILTRAGVIGPDYNNGYADSFISLLSNPRRAIEILN